MKRRDMKYSLVLMLVACFLSARSQTDKPFVIIGEVAAMKAHPKKVYYSYKRNGTTVEDSADVRNSAYKLEGRINEPVIVFINAAYGDTTLKYDYRRDYKIVHLSPGDKVRLTHSDSFSKASVEGSLAHAEFLMLEVKLRAYGDKINALWPLIERLNAQGDTLKAKVLQTEIRSLANEMSAIYPAYIRQNPSSPIAIFAINQYRGPFLKADEIEPLYNMLSADVKNTPSAKALYNKIQVAKKVAIGKPAPNVTQRDSLGKMISLADFKGKYVLLEFWASWCAPCRAENPNLVKTYELYKSKGFEIFGVSVDESRRSWLSAVKKDSLTWTNTADLLGSEKNPAALAYGVEAIPNNFLIDPQGKIVGLNLRGKELERKLAELLD